MALDSFTKQAYEEFMIAGEFTNVLDTGETIIAGSSTVVALDKDETDVSSVVLDQTTKAVDGSQLKIRARSGESTLSPYKITFKIVTNTGNKWEKDVNMKVREM